MADAVLKCNIESCRKTLEDKAFVTSCSHIFCPEHGQGILSNEKCLACGTKCRNKYDCIVTDLQPTDQYKAMLLSGLNPEQILEIATRSISFYTYQLNHENEMKETVIKKERAEKEHLQSYCKTMTANFKADLEKVKKAAELLKEELNEKIKEIQKQKEYLCNYSRLNKKLQLQLDSCKRQIVNLRTKSEEKAFLPTSKESFNLQMNGDRRKDKPSDRRSEHRVFSHDGEILPGCSDFTDQWPNARHSH